MAYRAVECRLVLDTNTLVSRMLAPRGVAARAVDRALAAGVLLASDESMSELANVLSRPKFDPYVSRDERQRFLRLLHSLVRMVPIHHRIQACRDPKDDMLLHVALNGEARYLISGDHDLLALADSFAHNHALHILSPAGYLAAP
jgi:putative PIN family toxin of toxin-antitoxin system